ncbi:MAG: thioredoxin-disulfide reductase [Lachnospiraceae bacterium]|nr:thioredoxin-disulfide reductase [Lachnospiraceae bacterium]MDD6182544.1 thioredoxin-disulfide reductase [Lachnospiraceae bacterium]MDD7379064.1 thioredoxin-disulfide reductase [Lachnospiraceae bacterium]MDY4616480.1 thioredoxin-disulfide reductase [Lachnospiraceae bacterium]MDY5774388.1 thioredoxin-disulfide reductase [Lachnospiraceae bacterium]
MLYDVIIIGSGPAGLSAAIYAQRAKLATLVIEKAPMSGGQILNTYEVDNYPGIPGVGGFDLGSKFRAHADALGCSFVTAEVREIQEEEGKKKIVTEKETYETKTLILATGATHRKLGVPGEEELMGMGVSYCATCDGAFFKGKTTAVIGGGDVALEDALFLARLCEKVYLVHRRDEFRGAKVLQERVFETENIEVVWDSVVEEIQGEDMVEKISIYNKKKEEKSELEVQGVFIAVGIQPNTEIYRNLVKMDEGGYIIAGEDGVTQTKGVFAAGDLRTKQLRQVITAASDGANAVTSVEKYLYENQV